jgi:hypothetical protein
VSNARIVLFSAFASLTVSCGGPVVHAPGFSEPPSTGGRSGSGTGGTGGSGGSGGEDSTPADGGILLPDSGTVAPPPDAMPSTDTNCGLRKVELKSKPGQALLLLDRSGSMAQRLVAGDPMSPIKWDETVSALDLAIDKTDEAVSWGVKVYPIDTVCGVRDGVEVPLAATNHDAIMTAIRANKPVLNGGATPTQQAVRTALAFVKSQPELTDPYLVIATDGLPNCAGNGADEDESDEAGAVMAVAEARVAGLRSFVVGIATADTDAHITLNQMAEAGGFPRNDPTTKYFSVAKKDDIVAAFQTITGQIASCAFPLNPPPPVPDNVAVEIDGRRLGKDPTNGWQYTPTGDAILLVGAACDQIKAAPKSDVQILFGCPAQPIP